MPQAARPCSGYTKISDRSFGTARLYHDRVKGRLSAALTGTSLLMTAVFVFLWIWSYRGAEITWERRLPTPSLANIFSVPGRICCNGYREWKHPVRFQFLDFHVNTRIRGTTSPWFIGIPYWSLVLLSLLSPACIMIARGCGRLRDSRAGCSICGYDLRATPERCPECGTLQKRRASGGVKPPLSSHPRVPN